ncbi:hypothetical protein [Microbacterium indicum]|nr:hypothetical protein [Microbacterium indicum]
MVGQELWLPVAALCAAAALVMGIRAIVRLFKGGWRDDDDGFGPRR